MKRLAIFSLLALGLFLPACENNNQAALRPDESYTPTATGGETGDAAPTSGSLSALDAGGSSYGSTYSPAASTTDGSQTSYDPVYKVDYQPATSNDQVLTPSGASSSGRTHVVQKGDTLYSIARTYYADQKRWRDIYNANRTRIPDPNSIKIGTKLIIP